MPNGHDMGAEIRALESQRAMLLAVITHALTLLDQLLTEMRLANLTPSAQIIISKAEFDRQMRILLGRTDDTHDTDATTGSRPRNRGGITG